MVRPCGPGGDMASPSKRKGDKAELEVAGILNDRPRGAGMRESVEVIVDDLVPPGRVYIIDRSALGFEGKLVAFHPEQRGKARRVEELLAEQDEKYEAVLRSVATLKNLTSGPDTSDASE